MRVGLREVAAAAVVVFSGAASAQIDICTNIRLSVSEQIECRGRLANALGDMDRTRIQQEFEDRVRRAQDQLITPPVLSAPPPPVTSGVPPTARPPTPRAPDRPKVPGEEPAIGTLRAPPAGQIAKPGEAPPAGNAVVPDLTAPDPTDSPLPPISPLPVNPAGAFPKSN
ncbi:MAG: hypothetical protein AB7E79_12690 [Rhodospirillaceae bacterium]